MSKKLLSLLLALVMTVSVLAGCAPSTAHNTETIPSEPTATESTVPSGPSEAPSDPAETADPTDPAQEQTDAPVKPEETRPQETKPAKPEETKPSKPEETEPAKPQETEPQKPKPPKPSGSFDISKVPAYSGRPYVSVNDGQPYFRQSEITAKSFEKYSDLDSLGRCGMTWASVGKDLMPTGSRGEIGSVKPTGWHTVKYDCVDGKYLYNRCHLIGWQLTGENANTKNLITGTRYLNIKGMLPFENMVADYVKEFGNHVMYRVTPIFKGKNLVADGVLMEGWSVEDNGDGICFCVFAYNVQPGIVIDYATGDSKLAEEPEETKPHPSDTDATIYDFVVSINSKKFHVAGCPSAENIKEENRRYFHCTYQEMLDKGYEPCKNCDPHKHKSN